MLFSGLMGCSHTGPIGVAASTTQQDASHADREKAQQPIDQAYGYEFAPQSDVATQETLSVQADVVDKPEEVSAAPVQVEHLNEQAVTDIQTTTDVTTVSSAQQSDVTQKDWVYLPGINEKFPAQLDRDAEISQLSTTDVNYFQRSGQDWVQFSIQSGQRKSAPVSLPVMRWMNVASAKTHSEERHAVVVTWIEFGKELKEQTEFMLTDASQRTRSPVLFGQSFFRDMTSHEMRRIIDIFN
ncbi:Uncharacterized conserved protein [Vibrio gazogenes DSM 21264]|uniref:Uncharacterized conserved protein n=2 Tax=Vibrio gazogenes TaxID=687 RepID=A0A1M4U1D7_VIBGA|nr:Uncharacterized conserved protein [Vibrio gazogenes DSM 21264] [Vibrio gazogenes DSM 21264 = NBRC 103151]SJN53127.1 hypothetical protein BQ6471_00271 [Vibrio gazogenes]